ncbi:MAG TPA: enoyl-CoA hydratase/isomerase family protein [Vicinamibacteria bacterium]|nr:enoyl-CoA hydratase/isomerase family protein [Vicinamibacteria bacterium]
MSLIRREVRGRHLVLILDKPRGNAMDPALVEELLRAASDAAEDASVGGVLIASAHPTLFCPGLDLVELYALDRPAMRAFMLRFAEAMWAFFGLPKPVVAGVSGHAVAGGCILAMTADWRVLTPGAQIGLNEVKIGVPLPWSVALLLRHTVAPASYSRVALLGRNFEGEEALRAGLTDELAARDGFLDACLRRLSEFTDKDLHAFARTKAYLRGDAQTAMRAREAELLDEWLDGWFSPGTRERIRITVEALAKKA